MATILNFEIRNKEEDNQTCNILPEDKAGGNCIVVRVVIVCAGHAPHCDVTGDALDVTARVIPVEQEVDALRCC